MLLPSSLLSPLRPAGKPTPDSKRAGKPTMLGMRSPLSSLSANINRTASKQVKPLSDTQRKAEQTPSKVKPEVTVLPSETNVGKDWASPWIASGKSTPQQAKASIELGEAKTPIAHDGGVEWSAEEWAAWEASNAEWSAEEWAKWDAGRKGPNAVGWSAEEWADWNSVEWSGEEWTAWDASRIGPDAVGWSGEEWAYWKSQRESTDWDGQEQWSEEDWSTWNEVSSHSHASNVPKSTLPCAFDTEME